MIGDAQTGAGAGKSLQLALVTETFPPEINGVANTMRHVVEGLEQLAHRVHVIRPRQPSDRTGDVEAQARETLVAGVPIPGYRGLRLGLPVYRTLRSLWRETPPDAVYIATQGPLGHAALAAARATGIPTLTGFHTQFQEYSRHYGLGLLARPIIGALRRFHNRSDRTLVPSSALRAELSCKGFRNLEVFARGVDTDLFSAQRRRDDLRRLWGCPTAAPVVLYVGRLAAEKNLDLSIRAFQRIASTHPDARFVVVGDGPAQQQVQRSDPRLILTGVKTGVELAEHYASADLFLFPSLTETFGNVVLEAMASGLPVVSFDYAAAGSLIRSGHNGITVPTGDPDAFIAAAEAVAGDADALLALGRLARSTAEGLTWRLVMRSFERELRQVIEHHQSEPPNETLPATPE